MSLRLVHRQRQRPQAPKTMLQFNKCCCHFDLRTGSIIIGAVTAACALGDLVGAVTWANLSTCRSFEDGQRWAQSARSLGLSEDFVSAGLTDSFSSFSFGGSSGMLVLLYLLGALEAFYFHFSLMLLYGIWKERQSLVKLWVKASVVAMVLRLMFILPLIAQVLAADFIALGVSALVLSTGAIVLAVYFILVVHNYHIDMMSQKLLRAYARDWTDLR